MIEIERSWKERRNILNKEMAQERVDPDPIASVDNCSNSQLNMQYDRYHGKWEYIKKVVVGPDICQKCNFDFGCEKVRIEGTSDACQFFY